MLDPQGQGKINISRPKASPPGLAWVLSALRMAGFAAVEGAGRRSTQVVPEVDARALPTPIGVDAGSAIATKVFRSRLTRVPGLSAHLRPLVAAANALTVYPPGSAIIITDYSDSIRKVRR